MKSTSLSKRGKIIGGIFGLAALGCGAKAAWQYTEEPPLPPEAAIQTISAGLNTQAQEYMAGTLDANAPHATLKRFCSLMEQKTNVTLKQADAISRLQAQFRSTQFPGVFRTKTLNRCEITINRDGPYDYITTIYSLSDVDSAAEMDELRTMIFQKLPESDIEKISKTSLSPRP